MEGEYMDTQQMKYFITAAKCLNFTEAAMQLNLSQPTLSRQISALEAELKTQLFFRDHRKVSLSPAGKYLLQELEQLYQHYGIIAERIERINNGYASSLNLGILEGHMIDSAISDVLRRCRSKYPDMKIKLSRGSFNKLSSKLYDGSLDLALTLYFDIEKKEKLDFAAFCKTVDCIAVHKSHPLSMRETATLWDFRDDPFILLSPEDSPNAALKILEICEKEGFMPSVLYGENLETIMLWVESGLGIAVINQNNALAHNPNVSLIPCLWTPDSDLVLSWHHDNQSVARRLFLKEFESYKAQIKPGD